MRGRENRGISRAIGLVRGTPHIDKRAEHERPASEGGPYKTRNSLGFAEGLEVDAELLALLVKMAALEAESASDIGHVEVVAADFGEEDFAFERFGALLESSLPRRGAGGGDGCSCGFGGGENEADIIGGDGVFGGKKDEPLHNIAEFADIAGPMIATKFGDGVLHE